MSDTTRSFTLRRRMRFPNDKRIADDEFMAAAIGDTEWLRHSLREAKGKINFDKNGLSALHLSAIHGRLDCLKLLIEKYKVDINLGSTTGWRAVHLCISNQTGKRALICLQYLVTKKADLSIPNNDGITPIHQAASEGHVQCLKLLVQNGANIVGKDCRGHTPLDLAKLWGHKNCARLLAAELWHQDKNNVFKEMGHLKKMKMAQVLKEIEDENEKKAEKEIEGEKAFDDWLQRKELPRSHTGPNSKTTEEAPPPIIQTEPSSKGKTKTYVSPYAQPRRSILVSREERTPTPLNSRKLTDMSDDNRGLYGDIVPVETQSTPERRKKKFPDAWVNPESWRLALHPPKTEYICNLTDEYPRDEYTMMPMSKDAPKYYEGKHEGQENEADDELSSRQKKKKNKKPNLPKDVIEKFLSKDPSLVDRPIIFKPIHMFDIHKKKKYESEDQMKGEVSLHLCDDFKSLLYQRSLTDTGVLADINDKMSTVSSNSSSKSESLLSYKKALPHGLKQLHLKG
ncbi:hypothetical protein FSP39_005473 [Pinctada imbricata]|uniref:Ankyrin repeat domain-containing protein 53 n=1 Tax=Pinctada imbricata TaxID=66713 RepID=A0AA89BU46_PINIB|nr:hypothetical protein FSP39_005473 [Pinctada imbricata]